MKRFLASLILIVAVAACNSSKNVVSENSTISGKWDLKELNGKDIIQTYMRPVLIEFNETDSKVSGSAACNRFFGSFNKSGKTLTFNPLASTKMFCDEASNNLETEFLSSLEKVNKFKVENHTLLLMNENNVIAKFTESHSVPDELVGKWELFYITGRRIAFQGLYPEKKPTITFQKDSDRFAANTSCNSMSGSYNGKKGEKLFNPGPMTMMACPGEGEQAFLEQFNKVDRYLVSGDTLTFFNKDIPNMKFIKTNH